MILNVAVCNSRRWVAGMLCGMALGCAPPPARPHTRVRFAIGTPGGSIHALGEALAREWRSSFPEVDLEVHERTAAVSNIAAVARGDADVSFAYADVVYTAFAGAQRAGDTPADQIRGMALLQIAPVHLLVGRHVTARAITDLAGRQIGLGQPFSSTQLEAESLLNAFGIGGARVRAAALPFDEAAERLSRGTLDAFFLTASYPAESVTRAMEAGAALLPLEGPVVESLRRESVFLRPAVIPAGTYPGQREAVHTVGVHNVLVCRRDLDERLVHDLTRRFFEVLPALLAEQPSLRLIDVQQAPATPVPLHPGAARYYRELELAR